MGAERSSAKASTARGSASGAAAQTASAGGERDFVISRVFDAPRALVFKAWTEPKQMAQWWGPRDCTNPVCEMDVRPGGAYRIVVRAPEGGEYPMRGVFREVVAPERLAMTMDLSEHPAEWQDMLKPNRAKGESNPAGEILLTVMFEDLGGKTRLTARMRFVLAEIRDSMVKMGMNDGWSQSLDRLADVVKKA